tara:strand:- start:24579 stop:24875 length:297 start_codon:yes stop_codon:yes gene_type:complete
MQVSGIFIAMIFDDLENADEYMVVDGIAYYEGEEIGKATGELDDDGYTVNFYPNAPVETINVKITTQCGSKCHFMPDYGGTSLTHCIHCGKEKWQHEV